jgi:hypothetical protein
MKKVFAIFAIAALTACGGAETPAAETATTTTEAGTPTSTVDAGTPTSTVDAGTPTSTTDAKVEAKDAKAPKADAPKVEKKK